MVIQLLYRALAVSAEVSAVGGRRADLTAVYHEEAPGVLEDVQEVAVLAFRATVTVELSWRGGDVANLEPEQ